MKKKERYKMSYLYSNILPKDRLDTKLKKKSIRILIKHQISKELIESLSDDMITMIKEELVSEKK